MVANQQIHGYVFLLQDVKEVFPAIFQGIEVYVFSAVKDVAKMNDMFDFAGTKFRKESLGIELSKILIKCLVI